MSNLKVNEVLWEQKIPNDYFTIGDCDSIHKGFHEIKIERDENYNLVCNLRGKLESIEDFGGKVLTNERLNLRKGEILSLGESIKINTANGKEVEIDSLIITDTKISNGELKGKGKTNLLKIIEDCNKKEKYIFHWFLNGHSEIAYLRSTIIRAKNGELLNLSIGNDLLKGSQMSTEIDFSTTQCSSRNSIELKVYGKKFTFGYRDERDGLKSSFIYYNSDAKISDDELDSIIEILMFILGAELIYVGYTKYAENHEPIEHCYISTYKKDIYKIISKNNFNPVPIGYEVFNLKIDIEKMINDLIEGYSSKRQEFHLDKIIWYIQLAKSQNILTQIQPLSTVFDRLADSWFKSEYSESKGKKVQITNKLIDFFDKEELLKKVNEIFKDEEGLKKLFSNKIKNFDSLGFNQKNQIFLEELGLKYSKVEKKIMNDERNASVHGRKIRLNEYNFTDIVHRTNGFFSLINRIFLKLIESDYPYIDYSTYDFPIRDISSPLGGPNDDQKI